MPNRFPTPHQPPRDGTSQAARVLDALDPRSAPLDERDLPELLAQIQALADQLRWFDEQDRPVGVWDRLFDPDVGHLAGSDDPERARRISHNLARLAAFADDPELMPAQLVQRLSPPHVTLLLVVLKLFTRVRERLNELTARHLDHYYREILQFQTRPAEPDRVHVLVAVARGRRHARLPKGSLLAAGQDAAGRERVYRTELELSVNRTQVTELRSLFAEIRITDPVTVRRDHPKAEQVIDLLQLAIGDPDPGDALPHLKPAGWPKPDQSLFAETLPQWINFARESLHLEFFDLRKLVELKQKRDDDQGEWESINKVLNTIGRRRTGQSFSLRNRLGRLYDNRDFGRNLQEALGEEPDFSGVSEVDNIDDLFDLRDREEVREFLRNAPYNALAEIAVSGDLPQLAPDVVAMMNIKRGIDLEWQGINNLLEQAGRGARNDLGFAIETRPDFKPTEFEANLAFALPTLDFSALPAIGTKRPAGTIADYMEVIGQIEAYLYMNAESARFLFNRAFPTLRDTSIDEVEERQIWDSADTILTEARGRKAIAQRRQALQAMRDTAPNPEDALRAILSSALGLPAVPRPVLATLLDAALPLLRSDADRRFLQTRAGAIASAPPSEAQWTRLIRLAELIQRGRLGAAAASMEKHSWIDLQAYPGATVVYPENSESSDANDRRWRTFGQPAVAASADTPPQPVLGWAMSSPVLAMRQGHRRIELKLHFAANREDLTEEQIKAIQALIPEGGFDSSIHDAGDTPLHVELSGAEGWLAGDKTRFSVPELTTVGKARRLSLVLHMDIHASSPAISTPPPELGIESHWPVLRLMLRSRWEEQTKRYQSPYPVLRVLRLITCDCLVKVGDPEQKDPELGLLEPLLRNDQSLLDPSKTFEPFGPRPSVGSRLAIADAELATKRLESLRFDLTWMGVPDGNLNSYYANYNNDHKLANSNFKVQISMIDRRAAIKLNQPQQLFDSNDAAIKKSIQLGNLNSALSTPPPLRQDRPDKDPVHWPRYLRWELMAPDFQHAVYPAEAAAKANQQDPQVLNPPYTPQLQGLAISYSARSTWDVSQHNKLAEGEALLHIHPFGYSDAVDTVAGSRPFLPAYNHAGELLIGLTDLQPPQRLTLLLQLAEGSANPDLSPAPVSWSYLDGDRWVELDRGKLRRDGTRGLINSGIVELDLPPAASGNRLPADRYWLRLAVNGQPRSLCDSVAIATQAVSAVFVDNDNDPSHYTRPLPADSITKPVRPIAGIAAVTQPYTSFGARPAEAPHALRTRSSERLRHRNRALSPWDYEHLVLERFPQVHKVKCIAAAGNIEGKDLGKVRIVVIPDIVQQRPSDPFAPKAAASLLTDIQHFLQARVPLCARVQVDNAVFVPVKVRIGIQFHNDVDAELARSDLNDALNRYLSPWAFEDGADIVIGESIYANSIIDFLERQDVVDYVRAPKLFRFDSASGHFLAVQRPTVSDEDGYHVAATTPDQVLVSARQNNIDIIQPGVKDEEELIGIGYMKIELDFVIAENPAPGA